MKVFIKYLFIFLAAFSGSVLRAQTPKESFQKVNEKFASLKNVSYSIAYSYFESRVSKVPIEKATGLYKKYGNNYYSKIADYEILANDKYRVIVDNGTKHIVVENRPVFTNDNQFTVNLDSALAICKKITSKRNGSVETYSLLFDSTYSDYSQIDIAVDESINFVKKIILYLKEKDESGKVISTPRVEISLSNVVFAPSFSDKIFSETNYVSIDDNGYVNLNKSYSTYTLLNTKVLKK